MGKLEVFSIKLCFRSVFNHPFLFGMLCFLIFLYRTFPLIFSLLVSASPALVCTAILLGTLLSFGQSSIPEIEMEVKATCDTFLMKRGASGGATGFEKNESYYAKYSERKMDEMEELIEKSSFTTGKFDEGLIEESLLETELENHGNWKANIESGNMDSEQKSEWRLGDGEALENHYASLLKMSDDEHLELDDETSVADSLDSERVSVDTLDSPPHSHEDKDEEEDEEEEEEEEEDDDSDLGSDIAESSSSDASMAEIMPMLDELHPFLDEDAPQPVHTSHDGSDAESELFLEASTSNDESDEESENHKVLEVADEDVEDGEDEEDLQGDYEEQAKSAITWTEEDQKNLMDLGSSEIERNQWLEKIILRRK